MADNTQQYGNRTLGVQTDAQPSRASTDVQNFLNALHTSLTPSNKLPRTGYDVDPGAFLSAPSNPSPNLWHQILQSFTPDWTFGFGGTARELGGSKGGDSKQTAPADPRALTGDAATAQWLIGQIPNMKQGQLNTPSPGQQQALISAINNLDPADAQKVMAALPKGATITQDVMKAEQPGGPQTPNDVLTMGMNLFMNQYMQPLMAKMNAANMQGVQQYAGAMNQALQGPLPPGVAQFAKAMAPQMEGNMAMLNQANAAQAAGAPMFNAFMSGVGGEAQNLQQLIDIYTKLSSAADVQQLYGTSGLPGVLGAPATGGTTTGGTTSGVPTTGAGTPAINLTPAQILQSVLSTTGG